MNRNSILFIDFYGTICFDHFWHSLDPRAVEKLNTWLFVRNRELVLDWMRGKYSYEEICKKISVSTDIAYKKLIESIENDARTMHIANSTLKTISKIKEKIVVVLITDNMDTLTRLTIPTLGLNRYFDSIVNSHAEQRLKLDGSGASYMETIKNFGVSGTIYTIDDTASACRFVESFGGVAYQVTKATSAKYFLEKLMKEAK